MEILEKDLEDIIYSSDKYSLENRGLKTSGKMIRQVKIGNYGLADLITYERMPLLPFGSNYSGILDEKRVGQTEYISITIYELKKNTLSFDAFIQALRYTKGISRFLEKNYIGIKVKYKIVLIGRTFDVKNDFIYLTDFINSSEYGSLCSLDIYSYEYGIDGIKFYLEEDYHLHNECLKIK